MAVPSDKKADTAADPPARRRPGRALLAVSIVGAAAMVFAVIAAYVRFAGSTRAVAMDPATAAYVGGKTCARCHAAQAAAWRPSHHAHAMQEATDDTVLGDFDDALFTYDGITSRFFRKDGKFFVNTDGPDGAMADFAIAYTFGIDPLQQYLIAFPDGRLQALSIAWDARPKEAGGQRWFHLHPDEAIRHGDVLHWTGINQNWNFMCAECHSTAVRKNYDAASDRFHTTWSDISVNCEACHGPGSRHVAWAQSKHRWWPSGDEADPRKGLAVAFNERSGVTWSQDPASH